MRKRKLYQQSVKPSSKVPTIIIMCCVLFAILYFGDVISNRVAGIVVTDEPKLDVPVVPPGKNEETALPPPKHHDSPGSILYEANLNTLRLSLDLLAGARTK